jgi:hypothetical protein
VSDAPDLRVSDQERERAAEEIRQHFAAGRLDEDELNDRLAAAYAAKTSGELATLRADLPKLPATRGEMKLELTARRGELTRRLLQQTGASLTPFAICTAIWAAGGATGFFWPLFVLWIAVVPLLRNGWRLYGPAPELDRVERHLERRERGRERRDHRRRRGGRRHRGRR